MKFMLLIWSNPQNWDTLSATERQALAGDGVAEHAALDAALIDSGELVVSRDDHGVAHDGSAGVTPEGWLPDRVSVGALTRAFPPELVDRVVATTDTRELRRRRPGGQRGGRRVRLRRAIRGRQVPRLRLEPPSWPCCGRGWRRWRPRTQAAGHRAGHPAPGGQVFRRGDALVSRFQFVADHRHAYEVKRLCEIVEVARSSFYAWLDAAPTARCRAAADAELADRIRAIHERRQHPGRAADHRRAQRRRTARRRGSTTSGSPG